MKHGGITGEESCVLAVITESVVVGPEFVMQILINLKGSSRRSIPPLEYFMRLNDARVQEEDYQLIQVPKPMPGSQSDVSNWS